MSVFGLFRKQDIIVTDVTRMESEKVCIACLRGRQQMRLKAPQPTRIWLDSIGGLKPGDIVSLKWRSVKRFRPPHSEDGDWTPSSLNKTGALAYEQFYDVLAKQAKSSVRSAFGDPAFLARRGNPAFPADRGKRSLGTMRASSIRIYKHENKLRADFQDEHDHWSMVPVEDLRLLRHLDECADEMETYYLRQRLGFEMTTNSIAHRLPQSRKLIGFRKNGSIERARRVTALGRLFDKEYEFSHMK